MTNPSEEPRLHVDSDWKAQAQAEKERLARQEEERTAKQGPRNSDALPPADFRSLVGVLASQAMSGLGIYGDEKGRVIVDPIGAKFAIDLLAVLEEKTKGNLSKEEAADIEGVVRELRMRFVQVMQMVARQGDLKAGAGGVGEPSREMPAVEGGGASTGRRGAPASSEPEPPPTSSRLIVP